MRKLIVSALCLAVVSTGCSKGKGVEMSGPTAAGVVPGADLVVWIDMKAISETPISQKMQAREELKNDPMTKLLESFGIKNDMIAEMIISADLDGFDPKAGPAALIKTPFCIAAALTEPLTPDTLGGLLAMAKDTITVTKTDTGGTTVYAITPKSGAPALAMMTGGAKLELLLALSGDGKALYVTLGSDAMSAMLKRAAGKSESIPANVSVVRKSLPEGCQMWMGLRFTDAMLKDVPKDGGPMFPAIDPTYAGCGLVCGDTMDFTIVLDIGNENAAKQVAGLMQMGIMGAMGQVTGPGGKTPPFMSTLASATEGSVIKLSFTMTEADLEQMAETMPGGAPPMQTSPPAPREVAPAPRKAPSAQVAPIERTPTKRAMNPAVPATMKGRKLSAVKAELGRPRGVLKAEGQTTWAYGDFDVVSVDGKTVSRVETADDFKYVPVRR